MTADKVVMVVIAACGVILTIVSQLYIAGKNRGVIGEKIKQHGYDILELQTDSKDHGARLSNIEGRLDAARRGSH